MTLPILTNVLIRGGSGERAIGAVYAWNTAGAIAGVILAVHFPFAGDRRQRRSGHEAPHFRSCLAAIYRGRSSDAPQWLRFAATPALAGVERMRASRQRFIQLDPQKLASGVFRHGTPGILSRAAKVMFLEHGKTATISLGRVG